MKSIITALWLEVEIFFEVTVSLHFQCTDRKGKKKKKKGNWLHPKSLSELSKDTW